MEFEAGGPETETERIRLVKEKSDQKAPGRSEAPDGRKAKSQIG